MSFILKSRHKIRNISYLVKDENCVVVEDRKWKVGCDIIDKETEEHVGVRGFYFKDSGK